MEQPALEEPVSPALHSAPLLEACELFGLAPGGRAVRHEAGGSLLSREAAGGQHSLIVVDVRTLQSLRIVVPRVPAPRAPISGVSAPALPTFDELLHGPGQRSAGSAGSAGLAGLPMIVWLAVRRRLVSRRRPMSAAGLR
jgi:hypothetical protein